MPRDAAPDLIAITVPWAKLEPLLRRHVLCNYPQIDVAEDFAVQFSKSGIVFIGRRKQGMKV